MSVSSSSRRVSAASVLSKASKATPPPPTALQNLQAENESLRLEIRSLETILATPVDENRRYTHFRYQIYSLEKQVALLTRVLDAKREAVATCETILIELSEFLESLKEKIQRKETIEQSLVQAWIDRIESNRKKSFKSMQDHASLSDNDTLYAPNSVKYVNHEPIHLLDVCSGRIDHLNLKNIANLESSLYNLHCDLRAFQAELVDQTNHSIFPNLSTSLVEHSKELSDKINGTANELFYLSLLVPTRHQKCAFAPKQITTDLLCQRINAQFRLSPNIKLFLQSIFDSLISAFNHEIHLLKAELTVKSKQLSFYRQSLTLIHCQYIQKLIGVLSTGQQSFNTQLRTDLYEPLVNIIKDYTRMSDEKTDDSLKSFLFTCKLHISQLQEIARDLYQQFTEGSKATHELFIEANERMWKDIEQEQKRLLEQVAAVQTDTGGNDDNPLDDLARLFQMS